MPHSNDITEDKPSLTVKSAVDRASSKTPLDESSHIDPHKVRQALLHKREGESTFASNAINLVTLDEDREKRPQRLETPPEHVAGFDQSPENTAKEKSAEMPRIIEKVEEKFRV